MIDADGYRPNVGIILANWQGQVLWARRAGQEAWQFPQGGIRPREKPAQAMYRELQEEIGLTPEDVHLIGHTHGWLRYRLPRRLLRHGSQPLCIGQKQIWFILRLLSEDNRVQLDTTVRPEFDCWRWVDYWLPLDEIVFFKRPVYVRALNELAPLLMAKTPGVPTITPPDEVALKVQC